MAIRGERKGGSGFESAESGTIYWTLSLYVEPHKVASALRCDGGHVDPGVFRKAQMRHKPSFALRNAIDPLMNDIADRETNGEVQEFLLAATEANPADMDDAAEEIRKHDMLHFHLPDTISWTTEGTRFIAKPPQLADVRAVRLRRFWFAHNNGALSYHLAFSHYYGGYEAGRGRKKTWQRDYDPATFYFLSILQKLAAPKEYSLDSEILERLIDQDIPYTDVFSEEPLGIDPLDNITVGAPGAATTRFWPFVRTQFERDAKVLFPRLIEAMGETKERLEDGFEGNLLELVPFIEVPGLRVPKSRFMFMLHDEKFFSKLMPLHPLSGDIIPRKRMVQDRCFEPYAEKISELSKPRRGRLPKSVHLGGPKGRISAGDGTTIDFWDWVCNRNDYDEGLKAGFFARKRPPDDAAKEADPDDKEWAYITSMDDLQAALHAGECYQLKNRNPPFAKLDQPILHNAPAFEPGRPDCLLYLFLAGFNQNIIDFMNQDTSEILDSIDPIYPKSDEQSDERFFVRYANHRAMITYVPKSRSLETGNDYIGTCPYAFLIHVLALHNEFLARGHEEMSRARIERIEAMVSGTAPPASHAQTLLNRYEKLEDSDDLYYTTEIAINQAKLAEFNEYERFRYANPFRYDTESDVFAKLEQLRGTNRKQAALALAIDSLEDHAADLRQEHRAKREAQEARREAQEARRATQLNLLLGGTGFFGAGQMMYWIGEKAAAERDDEQRHIFLLFFRTRNWPQLGDYILSFTEILMSMAVFAFLGLLTIMLGRSLYRWLRPRGPNRAPASPLDRRIRKDKG